MDPVVVVVVVVGCVVLGEQVTLLVATALGDETPSKAGRLWAPHKLVDMLGTVLVPALLAVVGQGPLIAFGWGRAGPRHPGQISGWRGVVSDLTGPTTHVAIAVAGLLLEGAVDGSVAERALGGLGLLLFSTNTLIALFLLAPLPPTPGGQLVLRLLRGAPARRWARWTRWSRAPFGLVVGAGVAWIVSTSATTQIGG